MEISMLNVMWCITNAIYIYTIRLFLKSFIEGKVKNKKVNFVCYIISYVCICFTTIFITSIFIKIIVNILILFLLANQYQINLQKKLLTVFNTYIILLIGESIVGIFVGFVDKSILEIEQYKMILGMVSIRILGLAMVAILSRFKNIKKEYYFPIKYWSALIIIPLGSIYLVVLILNSYRTDVMLRFVGLIAIMAIDFLAFYLYDMINQIYSEKVEKVLLEERTKYYAKRLLSLKDSVASVRKLQHDWKNHLIELGLIIQKNENQKALDYLEKVNEAVYAVKSYVNSGNIDVDGILNYKLYEAEKEGIEISFSANLPEEINITPFDCAIIFGNLLDNAIEGAKKCQSKKVIKGTISLVKGAMYMVLENTYSGAINLEGNAIATTKKDKVHHGLGLKNVRTTVEKYFGNFELSYDKELFRVEVLLYMQ